MADFVLLSCEHGGNRVPAEFSGLFRGRRALLQSHRGYDPGARQLARALSRRLSAPLHCATVTRLLVELNRSPGHRALFSEITRGLPAAERNAILRGYYVPYREKVEADVAQAITAGRRVVHLSLHTCAPVLKGVVRRMDVGLLYDPARPGEARLVEIMRAHLVQSRPDLVVRRNYPYLGKSDGFVTALRRRWDAARYVGIEIEVNQRWHAGEPAAWRRLVGDLADATAVSLSDFDADGRRSIRPRKKRQSDDTR